MTAVQALGTQAFPLLPETPRVRYLHRRNCWSDAPYDNWATSQARVRSALSTATIAWKTPLAWRLARDLPATVPSAYFDEAWLSAAWFALETQTELCEELDDRAHPGVHHHLCFSAGQWAELQRRPASLPQSPRPWQ